MNAMVITSGNVRGALDENGEYLSATGVQAGVVNNNSDSSELLAVC